MKTKMNTKAILVSFLAVVAVFSLVATASAFTWSEGLAENIVVKVDDTYFTDVTGDISVIAGETISVRVWFDSRVSDSDVTIEAELEGEKVDVEAVTDPFDVEPGIRYSKALTLKVPYELKDELSDDLELNIEIDGKEHEMESGPIMLRVQRPSYNPDIKSIVVDQTVDAGETFPVDIVLKNIGYNDLDDLYVSASIPALGLVKTSYFGDIVALECDDDDADDEFPWSESYDYDGDGNISDWEAGLGLNRNCNEDDEDTMNGRLYLEVPYGVEEGVYVLEVEVANDDVSMKKAIQVIIKNDFQTTIYKSGNSIWMVNPTNKVMGYRVVPESPASVSESMVFVPAGSSKTIDVEPNAEGDYEFAVKVFTVDGDLVETITFSGSASEETETNPIVVLTVVLAIIFIVLLIVLIVLLGKKPEKSGEFGESYY